MTRINEIQLRDLQLACNQEIGREELIGDARYATSQARVEREAEVDAIVSEWTRGRTKHQAMAQLSSAGVPAGAVLDSMDLVNEPSFRERQILQTMTHGERSLSGRSVWHAQTISASGDLQ